MKELISFIVGKMVDNPDAVEVTQREEDETKRIRDRCDYRRGLPRHRSQLAEQLLWLGAVYRGVRVDRYCSGICSFLS